MRRKWGGWRWGVSKSESPAFQSPEASQRSARMGAFRLVYRVRGQRSGSPLKRGCVGGTVAWALGGRCPGGGGWVELGGGEDSYPEPTEAEGLSYSSLFPGAQRKSGTERQHLRFFPSPSCLLCPPSCHKISVSMSCFTRITHPLYPQSSKVRSGHCRHDNHCLPSPPMQIADPSAPGLISSEAWDLEPRYLGEMPGES